MRRWRMVRWNTAPYDMEKTISKRQTKFYWGKRLWMDYALDLKDWELTRHAMTGLI